MWDQLAEPWQVCLALAWESYCEGSIPIAAVVTDPRGHILSRGRNRVMEERSVETLQISGGPLAHAELNALLALDWGRLDIRSCDLFSLVEPCPLCIGAICMAGVKVVRYAARDAWSGGTDLLEASPYLRWKAIRAVSPEDARLESIVHMLQVDAELRHNHPRLGEVLDTWSRRYPRDITLGRRLHESQELQRLRLQGCSGQAAITRVAELIEEWTP